MSSLPHESPRSVAGRPDWSSLLRVREMWSALAITAMWVAVFVTAIWGPDAEFHSVDGSGSTIPSAIFVTVFAFLGTWIVGKYGLRQQHEV